MRNYILSLMALASVAQLHAEGYTDYARVKSSEPQYERVSTDRQVCWNETVNVRDDRNYSGNNTAGMILGGATGAIVGHQFGGGRGRDAMTAIGAVTGAMIGNKWGQNDNNRNDSYRTEEVRRCRNEPEWTQRITGYKVTYEYAGRRYTTIMPNDPGRDMKVNVAVSPVF